jgi:uncharacterized protein (TIGR02284 family)
MKAMENEKLIDVLNDLIRINNDRIQGYAKATEELNKPGYDNARPMFLERTHESRVFVNELSSAVGRLGGEPAENTTASGKLYRTWMDLKTAFTGGSAKSVFELCEFGEDAALKAYDEALEDETVWSEEIFNMLTRQRQMIREAHDAIKRYRDRLKAANV